MSGPKKFEVKPVKAAFERDIKPIRLDQIAVTKPVLVSVKHSPKYKRIEASVKEIGIIEPLVVARTKSESGKWRLLDGHLRLSVLHDIGAQNADCLISTDDEAYTYNKHINQLSQLQEHRMIARAIERGVPADRLSRVLNIQPRTLKQKIELLVDICPEAVELLQDKGVSIHVFDVLRKIGAPRQLETAQLMVAMDGYSISHARALLAATPQSKLRDVKKQKVVPGLTRRQMAQMEREAAMLEPDFKAATKAYGGDHLELVATKGYVAKLLANSRVVRYLVRNHQSELSQLQKLVKLKTTVRASSQ